MKNPYSRKQLLLVFKLWLVSIPIAVIWAYFEGYEPGTAWMGIFLDILVGTLELPIIVLVLTYFWNKRGQ